MESMDYSYIGLILDDNILQLLTDPTVFYYPSKPSINGSRVCGKIPRREKVTRTKSSSVLLLRRRVLSNLFKDLTQYI